MIVNQIQIPRARVVASCDANGRGPFPAVAVFEAAARDVIKRFGMVDMGLDKGTLCTDSAIIALATLYPFDLTKSEYCVEEVIQLERSVLPCNIGPAWAIYSAEKFMFACAKTKSKITIAPVR